MTILISVFLGKSIKEGKWLRGKPTVIENKKEKHDAR